MVFPEHAVLSCTKSSRLTEYKLDVQLTHSVCRPPQSAFSLRRLPACLLYILYLSGGLFRRGGGRRSISIAPCYIYDDTCIRVLYVQLLA